ncbi:MAG: hypothetical protein R6V32_04185 [Bacteroidales bacterium]
MLLRRIFGDNLFAIQYPDEDKDEFERLFDLWNNMEFLEEFFSENEKDLNSKFWGGISVEEAAMDTKHQAEDFEDKLEIISKQKNTNKCLNAFFKQLDDYQSGILILDKRKAKHSWLRIYALRIDTNAYLITGGAIKLTKRMEDREHTRKELNKIDQCKQFLIEQGITDKDGLLEII